jgi:3-hydroxyacyl-[acyl-carrier-protein] dehydratase
MPRAGEERHTLQAAAGRLAPAPRDHESPVTATHVLPPAEIGEILKNIPHRHPFLLIDRMEACEPGKWVRAVKNVTSNDAFFAGVPRDRRVMPQMLVVEALAQSSGALCHYSGLMRDIEKPLIFFAGFDKCRFLGSARAGQSLILECRLIRALRDVVKVSGTASVDGEPILELELTAVIRGMDGATAVRAKGGNASVASAGTA